MALRYSGGLSTDYCIIGFAVLIASTLIGGAPITSEEPWWVNSCSPKPMGKARHGRSAEDVQIRIFRNVLRKSIKDFQQIYQQESLLKPLRLRWLKLKKIQTEVFNKEKNKLVGFHHSLQVFAIYLERLRRTTVRNLPIKSQRSREKTYENITSHLRIVLCEYEDAIKKDVKSWQTTPTPSSKPKYLRSTFLKYPYEIDNQMDLTDAHIADQLYLEKIMKFVKKNYRQVRRYKHRKRQPAFKKTF